MRPTPIACPTATRSAALLTLAGMLALIAGQALADAPFAAFERASEPVLADPHDLDFGPDGRLYVADKFASRIAVFDPDTLEFLFSFGDGELPNVHDISFGPDGRAWIAVTSASAVAVYEIDGDRAERVDAIGPFPRTEGALAHSNGRLYVTAGGTGEVLAVDGTTVVARGSGHFGAHDVEEAPDGSVWVADNNNRRLVHYSADLELLGVIEGPDYGFRGPRYLAFDDFGRMLVADQESHRVLMIDPATGTIIGALGDGTPGMGPDKFDDPEGVAVRGSAYYIADSDNNRIVKYVVVMN